MLSNGIDILRIKRFDDIKNKDEVMKKIFNDNELAYIKGHNNASNTIAGLFCAKEAILKALKKGINDYALTDIEIIHNDDQAPFVIFHNELLKLNIKNISISIAHDGDYAIASCIIEE